MTRIDANSFEVKRRIAVGKEPTSVLFLPEHSFGPLSAAARPGAEEGTHIRRLLQCALRDETCALSEPIARQAAQPTLLQESEQLNISLQPLRFKVVSLRRRGPARHVLAPRLGTQRREYEHESDAECHPHLRSP